MRALLLFGLLLACSAPEQPVEAEFATYPYREPPVFEPIPEPTGAPAARPAKYAPDGRPTVLLFTASWCPPCVSSQPLDLAIAREYGDRFQVGVALVDETDADFTSSAMARVMAGVTVWNAESVYDLAVKCRVRTIPTACLVEDGRVVFRGAPINLRRVLDLHVADRGSLEAELAAAATRHAVAAARLPLGVSPDEYDELVEATSSDPHWQHATAFALAARPDASATDLALAVALARAAAIIGGGLDYWHLDTYSLALSKAGRAEDAQLVSWRVLGLCARTKSKCMMERRRANVYIWYWQQTGGKPQH